MKWIVKTQIKKTWYDMNWALISSNFFLASMQLKWNKQSIKIYKIIFNKIKTLFDLSLKTRLILTPFIMDSSTMFWSFLCNTTKRKTTLFFTNKFILHLFWRLGSLEVVFFFLSRKHFFPSIMSDRSLLGSMPWWPSFT